MNALDFATVARNQKHGHLGYVVDVQNCLHAGVVLMQHAFVKWLDKLRDKPLFTMKCEWRKDVGPVPDWEGDTHFRIYVLRPRDESYLAMHRTWTMFAEASMWLDSTPYDKSYGGGSQKTATVYLAKLRGGYVEEVAQPVDETWYPQYEFTFVKDMMAMIGEREQELTKMKDTIRPFVSK